MDVVDFEIEPKHTVFYFSNPFAANVLAEVLKTIQKSLRDAPRTAWLLYSNPAHRKFVEGMPGFAEEWRETWGSTESIVYRCDPRWQCADDRSNGSAGTSHEILPGHVAGAIE
jgi:hypothetical protein